MEYIYTTSTSDSNNYQLYYKWDWGNGAISDWLGPYESGEDASASHNWSRGNYKIKVKAMNTNGDESPWSDPLPISMPIIKFNKLYSINVFNKIKEFLNNYSIIIYN